MLARILANLLTASQVGRQWAGYLPGEAELLTMVANRLNLPSDEELRETGRDGRWRSG